MLTEDRMDDSPDAITPDADTLDEYPARLPDRYRSRRRPNAFGCLLLITGALFGALFVLGMRAYFHIAAPDIVSLTMIGFVGIMALGQLIVGVWMLRGSSSGAGWP